MGEPPRDHVIAYAQPKSRRRLWIAVIAIWIAAAAVFAGYVAQEFWTNGR